MIPDQHLTRYYGVRKLPLYLYRALEVQRLDERFIILITHHRRRYKRPSLVKVAKKTCVSHPIRIV